MKILRIVSTVAIVSVLCSFLPRPDNVLAQEVVYQEDFEDRQAQDWRLDPGWQVIQVDGNYVLAGTGAQWARNDNSYNDYRLSFRLKIIKGGLNISFRNNNTGRYLVRFDAQGSRLSKQNWAGKFVENLAVANRSHSEGQWHQVEISGSGSALTFIVDGNTEWTFIDPDPDLAGSFAFDTWENSQVYVDDIKVELVATAAGSVDNALAAFTWTRTGGPLGGLGYDIRMQPGNPDSMLVTDAWSGVFASTDSGANWLPSNTGITVRAGATSDAIPIFALSFDPAHPKTVWAGTQYMRGIYKSTDGGANWTRKDQGIIEQNGISFRGFTVDPVDSNVVYAAAELSSWVWNNGQQRIGREFDMTAGVLYKTTDGGENWATVWRGDNLARYIWIDPRNTNVLYVSTGIFDREAANSNPQTGAPGGEGILKSTDGGRTWNHANQGLDNLYVGSLFMHPTNPDILLAGTGNNQYSANAGVYLSQDAGATWVQTLKPNRGETIDSVEFSISNPRIAYAGSDMTIFRSEDGGLTWAAVSGGPGIGWGPPGVRAGFPIDFQVDPRNPDRIFANEYGGGNFLSEDGGKTWVDASRGYTGAAVRAIAVFPNEPGHVIAAARSGIFDSSDGGANWTGLNHPPVFEMGWTAVAIDPTDSQHLVAANTSDNCLVTSRNGGAAWKQTLNFRDERIGWNAISFAPSDPNIVYAGSTGYISAGAFNSARPGRGIYISRDGGDNWLPANNSLTQDAAVFGLAVDPNNPQVVFAATFNHGLLKTSTGGQDWQMVNGGLPQVGAITVAISLSDAGFILAGFERQALYLSLDGGQTWKLSAGGMNPEAQITSVVFDPTSATKVVYAADLSSGVYRSADAGQTWSSVNIDLLLRSVNALALSSDGLHLYAASEGGGVFRLDINGQPPATVLMPTLIPTTAPEKISTQTSSPDSPPAPAPETTTPGPGGMVWLAGGGVALLVVCVFFLLWKRRKRG
jgi:photosystem II stability/assembly factor-like uncharacterized protein